MASVLTHKQRRSFRRAILHRFNESEKFQQANRFIRYDTEEEAEQRRRNYEEQQQQYRNQGVESTPFSPQPPSKRRDRSQSPESRRIIRWRSPRRSPQRSPLRSSRHSPQRSPQRSNSVNDEVGQNLSDFIVVDEVGETEARFSRGRETTSKRRSGRDGRH